MKLEDHPTVRRIRLKTVNSVPARKVLDGKWLKQPVLDAGADGVGAAAAKDSAQRPAEAPGSVWEVLSAVTEFVRAGADA
jgi:hypothetical protein